MIYDSNCNTISCAYTAIWYIVIYVSVYKYCAYIAPSTFLGQKSCEISAESPSFRFVNINRKSTHLHFNFKYILGCRYDTMLVIIEP